MNQDICLHAINNRYELYYTNIVKKKLRQILKDNALLSRRMQGLENSTGFNGMDYISLCDYQKRDMYHENHHQYTAFDSYIRGSLSLAFPKEKLSLINPYITGIINTSKKGYNRMVQLGMIEEVRYSDLYDEVQVKNKISLDLMCGITIPISKMDNPFLSTEQNTKNIIKHLNDLKQLLTEYNHLVPIYDIDSMTELTSDEDIKKLVKK